MEELPNEDDIELETLQAQVDLSLAYTKTLVSSWLKPTYGEESSSSSSRGNQDKEVEDLLRRPARLGVGAPIPSSTSMLGHETIKLKNKLTGKKRQREDEGLSAPVELSEDEEESRGRAIKKKAKVDPFAGGQRKRNKQSAEEHSKASVVAHKAALNAIQADAEDLFLVPVDSEPSTPAEQIVQPTTPLSPKKKKKKHHHSDDAVSSTTMSKLPECSLVNPVTDDASPQDSPKLVPPETLTSTHTPAQSLRLSHSLTSPSKSGPVPLLNLDGPPEAPEGEPSTSLKKKRKRKKKKKKTASGAGLNARDK